MNLRVRLDNNLYNTKPFPLEGPRQMLKESTLEIMGMFTLCIIRPLPQGGLFKICTGFAISFLLFRFQHPDSAPDCTCFVISFLLFRFQQPDSAPDWIMTQTKVECIGVDFIGVNLGHCAIRMDIAQYIQTLCNTVKIQFIGVNCDLRHCSIHLDIAQYCQNSSHSLLLSDYSVICNICTCFVVLLSNGSIGGADRTFACKSQECLGQDWYILELF